MDIMRAVEILTILADGIDPMTGEILPDDSVCNKADVVRAFHSILNYLDISQENDKGNPPNAGKPWSKKDIDELSAMFDQGRTVEEMQAHFQRSRGAIEARLVRNGKIASRDEAR